MRTAKAQSLFLRTSLVALPFLLAALALLLLDNTRSQRLENSQNAIQIALNINSESSHLSMLSKLYTENGQAKNIQDILSISAGIEYSMNALEHGGVANVNGKDVMIDPAGTWMNPFYHSFHKSWIEINGNINLLSTSPLALTNGKSNPTIALADSTLRQRIEQIRPLLSKLIESAQNEHQKESRIQHWVKMASYANFILAIMALLLHLFNKVSRPFQTFLKIKTLEDESLTDFEKKQTIREWAQLEEKMDFLNKKSLQASRRILEIVSGNQHENIPLENAIDLLDKKINAQSKQNTERQEKERIEKWQSEGLAQFDALQRKHGYELEAYAKALTKELARFFHALQAGLFLLEADRLRHAALFAYDRDRMSQASLPANEGLLARALQERQHVHLTELPQGYLKISSGLGERMPEQLLILPMTEESSVVGVIELASFEAFRPEEIEFAQVLANNAANVLGNLRTAALKQSMLEAAQADQERMQHQEEELRQNLEELQATQEALSLKDLQQQELIEQLNEENEERLEEAMRAKRQAEQSRAEMQGIINALETSTWVAQYSPEGFLIDANSLAFSKLGIEAFQGKGLPYPTLFPDSPAKEDFWHKLRQGQSQHIVHELRVNGQSLWLSENFTPVWNTSGQVEKVLALAQEITELKALEQFLEKSKAELELAQQDLAKKEAMLEEALQEIELAQEEMQEQQNALMASQKKSKAQIKELREKVKALETELESLRKG